MRNEILWVECSSGRDEGQGMWTRKGGSGGKGRIDGIDGRNEEKDRIEAQSLYANLVQGKLSTI